jgi:hypothetical protein
MIKIVWINQKPYVEHEGEYREATPYELEQEVYHD